MSWCLFPASCATRRLQYTEVMGAVVGHMFALEGYTFFIEAIFLGLYPVLTIPAAAAPAETLRLLLWTLPFGLLLLAPSLWFLCAVFKQEAGSPAGSEVSASQTSQRSRHELPGS